MSKTRLEAFSDGVIAILITIMVLELKVPHGEDWSALRELVPHFLTYLLSFIYLGIYWNNHHHMFQACRCTNGRILWANLNLLFWLSLIPVTTGWMGENHAAPAPAAAYGTVMFLSGLSYVLLQSQIIALEGPHSKLAEAVGKDWKGKASMGLYVLAVGLAFISPWISVSIYVLVALLWLAPDPRIESKINRPDEKHGEV